MPKAPKKQIDISKVRKIQTNVEVKDRVTIRFEAVHEHHGDPPVVASPIPYSKPTKYKEQAWIRRVEVGANWTPLELGWFEQKKDQVGWVVIENRAGVGRTVQPTEEERKHEEGQTVFVSMNGQASDIEIPHGEFHPFRFVDVSHVRIRADNAPVRVTLTIFPK